MSLRILQETRLTIPEYGKCKLGRLKCDDVYACGRQIPTYILIR